MAKVASFYVVLCVIFLGGASSISEIGPASNPDIKIEVNNGSVLIPGVLNGKQLQFLIDTGSSASLISETLIDELNLPTGTTGKAVGNYGTQSMRIVQVESFRVGNSEFHNQLFAVMDLDGLSRAMGVSVGGVLGNDILKGLTFQLNYSSQTVR